MCKGALQCEISETNVTQPLSPWSAQLHCMGGYRELLVTSNQDDLIRRPINSRTDGCPILAWITS